MRQKKNKDQQDFLRDFNVTTEQLIIMTIVEMCRVLTPS